MHNKNHYNKVLIFTLIAVASLLSYNLGKMGRGNYVAHAQSYDSSSTLSEVKSLLDEKFINWKSSSTPPTQADLDRGLIKGYVGAYNDPYTTYFEPVESKIFQETVKGSFGGVGIQIAVKDGRVVVISPVKDTPAYKAGIKAGDIVTKVESTSTDGMPIDKVIDMIRGDIGTKVKISVLRGTSTIEKDYLLERSKIEVPSIDSKMVDGVYVISLYNFSGESSEQFRQALLKFASANTDKLIIDLRGNPGGYLEAAVNMASFFLPEGKVIVTEKRGKNAEVVYHRSKGFNAFSDKLKLVVLVDQGSASASEILAGALKDQGIAKIVGKRTFGKGSVQELIDLCENEKSAVKVFINNLTSSSTTILNAPTATSDAPCNKGSIKITVAKWYTPNGVNISEAGIEPDYKVDLDEVKKFKGVDTQLMRAIQIAKGNYSTSTTLKTVAKAKVSTAKATTTKR